MLYYYLLFFFIAMGAKFLLALAMIYLLLPGDRRCSRCDGDTLLIRVGWLAVLSARRVQRRWCPRCGTEALARVVDDPMAPGIFIDSPERTRR